ncbi:phosphotransferase [Lentibacter algarum]|uniref:phosphotransferase enzyme family protein n=1 Tax=Lentibacter algarum TaxID=576131 RepID=UPI001C087EB0|nr:phosphotransferase [Lentibacter algarum]MBU2983153.1 phosphotransferase [Lentibacter algarum]
MTDVVDQALALWGFDGATCRLIAERENRVFRVDHHGKAYALRLHRAGYRTDAELWSELQWVAELGRGGLNVPAPVPSAAGKVLHIVEGIQIDVLTWLSGAPVGETGKPLQTNDRIGLFHKIGQEMARMHMISDAWTLPEGFTRCQWDRAGLVGDAPVWGRFWENPTLSDDQRSMFQSLRDSLQSDLSRLEGKSDYGLIHADLVRENVLADGGELQLIDFDDAGFGFRLFDLATTLLKNRSEPDYQALKQALVTGYLSIREIDLAALDLFLLARAVTYVGWIIPRMDEAGSEARNARFIDIATDLAHEYLARMGSPRDGRNGDAAS